MVLTALPSSAMALPSDEGRFWCNRERIGAHFEGASGSQAVLPAFFRLIQFEVVARKRIHRTIVRIRIGPPEAHGSHVRDAGTELLAQQPEQSEDQVAGVGGIGHDFPWVQVELLLQHSLQQK